MGTNFYLVKPLSIEEKQEIIVIIPNKFTFDVEILNDEDHNYSFYPKESKWTAKDALYICETDAKQKAEENTELIKKAQESLTNTIEVLMKPLLNESGYTIAFKSSAGLEV